MKAVKIIFRDILGLFVDDGSFALAILLWLGLVSLLVRALQLPFAGGMILFLGLAAILIESVTRFARRPPS